MIDRKNALWDALGALTFAELLEVAEVMRDAYDCTLEFETTDVQDWSFLLNTAREIAQDRTEIAA